MNLAIWITLSRIWIPFAVWAGFLYLDIYPAVPYLISAAVLWIEVSDCLDGWVARRWGTVSDEGKILDPTVDGFVRTSLFFLFTLPPVQIPILCPLLFLLRDGMFSLLRIVYAMRGIALPAHATGKVKAVLQGITLCGISIGMVLVKENLAHIRTVHVLATYSTALTTTYAFVTACWYLWIHRNIFKAPPEGISKSCAIPRTDSPTDSRIRNPM